MSSAIGVRQFHYKKSKTVGISCGWRRLHWYQTPQADTLECSLRRCTGIQIIAIGGIGTIAAILLVVLVLVATALPLLNSPRYQPWHSVPIASVPACCG